MVNGKELWKRGAEGGGSDLSRPLPARNRPPGGCAVADVVCQGDPRQFSNDTRHHLPLIRNEVAAIRLSLILLSQSVRRVPRHGKGHCHAASSLVDCGPQKYSPRAKGCTSDHASSRTLTAARSSCLKLAQRDRSGGAVESTGSQRVNYVRRTVILKLPLLAATCVHSRLPTRKWHRAAKGQQRPRRTHARKADRPRQGGQQLQAQERSPQQQQVKPRRQALRHAENESGPTLLACCAIWSSMLPAQLTQRRPNPMQQ